jgi:hypothetical protein
VPIANLGENPPIHAEVEGAVMNTHEELIQITQKLHDLSLQDMTPSTLSEIGTKLRDIDDLVSEMGLKPPS